jgi:hypothetical protein
MQKWRWFSLQRILHRKVGARKMKGSVEDRGSKKEVESRS